MRFDDCSTQGCLRIYSDLVLQVQTPNGVVLLFINGVVFFEGTLQSSVLTPLSTFKLESTSKLQCCFPF